MFVRIVTFAGATNIDGGITYIRDHVAPLIKQQKGSRGLTASADRAGAMLGVLSLWETEADRDASESALAKVREEGQAIIGGQVGVETYEERLVEVVKPPVVGAALLLRRVTMDPAKADESLSVFREQMLPLIKAQPGFRAVRNMINPRTGEGMTGTLWDDQAAMQAWSKAADEQVAAGRTPPPNLTLGERSFREILFVDLP